MEPTKIKKKWQALETSMEDDLTEYWGGDWGCDSEVGTLRSVLIRRPGKEIENMRDPKEYRWLDSSKQKRLQTFGGPFSSRNTGTCPELCGSGTWIDRDGFRLS